MRNIRKIAEAFLISICAVFAVTLISIDAYATGGVLPSAGIDLILTDGTSVKTVVDSVNESKKETSTGTATSTPAPQPAVKDEASQAETVAATVTPQSDDTNATENQETSNDDIVIAVETIPEEEKIVEETIVPTINKTVEEKERELEAKQEEEYFKNLVIAQVDRYVNVRADATTESDIVGKLYDKSVGELLEEKDGWYKISSGSCVGYVSAEYCVTGDAAIELAKEVGTRICTVNTTTLKVREEPSTDATVLGLIPNGDVLTVSEELDGWVKVNIEEGDGYVSLDYVKLSTEFVKAESKEEEEARLAKEEKERLAAIEAANKATKSNSSSSSGKKDQTVYATGGSELGKAVANYGLQFVGNPYVYGGTSLTDGADCSGFVMSVYKHFGVSLPHSSSADRSVGYAVASLAEAEPGDIICYSGHVAIYIGGGQIVHASTAKTGIKVGYANYRTILCIRRIF